MEVEIPNLAVHKLRIFGISLVLPSDRHSDDPSDRIRESQCESGSVIYSPKPMYVSLNFHLTI